MSSCRNRVPRQIARPPSNIVGTITEFQLSSMAARMSLFLISSALFTTSSNIHKWERFEVTAPFKPAQQTVNSSSPVDLMPANFQSILQYSFELIPFAIFTVGNISLYALLSSMILLIAALLGRATSTVYEMYKIFNGFLCKA